MPPALATALTETEWQKQLEDKAAAEAAAQEAAEAAQRAQQEADEAAMKAASAAQEAAARQAQFDKVGVHVTLSVRSAYGIASSALVCKLETSLCASRH